MTQDEIIGMAKEAGIDVGIWEKLCDDDIFGYSIGGIHENLEAFAKLVAAKEREAITDEYWSCVQSDLENGVKSLNQKATEDFYRKMPELSKFGRWLEARDEA